MSDEHTYDSDSSDDEDAQFAVNENGKKDEIDTIRISGQFIVPQLFEYRKKVAITVVDSHFFGSVKFRFYDDASITFEGNHCHGSAFFEGYGKLTANFSDCNFSERKTIIFHGNSSVNCNYVQYFRRFLCKGHAELRTQFHGCSCYGTFDVSAENLISGRCSVENTMRNRFKHGYRRIMTEFKKDMSFSFHMLFGIVVLIFTLTTPHLELLNQRAIAIANSRNSTEGNETVIFKPVDINLDATYCDEFYKFDEKVNVTVHGTTFMYAIGFKFKKDAHLTFIGVTCKSDIEIEGHAWLHTHFQDSSFHGEKQITFHGDGSMNCNGSTYLGRTTFDHRGKLRQNITNCVYVRAHYRT